MVASLHTKKYEVFRSLLVGARKDMGLTQIELSKRLNRQQSFVSKYENGERRLDLPEFVEIADAMGINPSQFLLEYLNKTARL